MEIPAFMCAAPPMGSEWKISIHLSLFPASGCHVTDIASRMEQDGVEFCDATQNETHFKT